MNKEKISCLINEIIKHKEQEGLSYREIAQKMRVTEATVVRWIKGKCIPHYSSLNLIEMYLNKIEREKKGDK